MYKMPDIPDSFPELSEMRYGPDGHSHCSSDSTDTILGLSELVYIFLH